MEHAQHAARGKSHAMHGDQAGHMHHYRRLTLMAVVSFAAMYGLMYAMVNTFDNVLPSFNQFYMAGLMAAPMVLIELALMGMMYPNKRANVAIGAASVVLGVAFWLARSPRNFSIAACLIIGFRPSPWRVRRSSPRREYLRNSRTACRYKRGAASV